MQDCNRVAQCVSFRNKARLKDWFPVCLCIIERQELIVI